MSYPISLKTINILFYDTTPGGLNQPLPGASTVDASKDDVLRLYKDWEEDLRVVIEVNL